jgi:pimeloyl-ACP methyl ester carboxylesterase
VLAGTKAAEGEIDDDAIRAALDEVASAHLGTRLDELADGATVFSSGGQQRIAFAHVLLIKPEAVFLDEATSALDRGRQPPRNGRATPRVAPENCCAVADGGSAGSTISRWESNEAVPETRMREAAMFTSRSRSSGKAPSTWYLCPTGCRISNWSGRWGCHSAFTRRWRRSPGLSASTSAAPGYRIGYGHTVVGAVGRRHPSVLDATGIERASLFGFSERGTMAAVFAARHPERVDKLVLFASHAGKVSGSPDFPCGYEVEDVIENCWGTGDSLEQLAPSLRKHRQADIARAAHAHFERMAATPGAALAHFRFNLGNDARSVMPHFRAPTLVLHRQGTASSPSATPSISPRKSPMRVWSSSTARTTCRMSAMWRPSCRRSSGF